MSGMLRERKRLLDQSAELRESLTEFLDACEDFIRGTPSRATQQEIVLWFLDQRPDKSFSHWEIAAELREEGIKLYPDSVSAALSALKKEGQVRHLERGEWRSNRENDNP